LPYVRGEQEHLVLIKRVLARVPPIGRHCRGSSILPLQEPSSAPDWTTDSISGCHREATPWPPLPRQVPQRRSSSHSRPRQHATWTGRTLRCTAPPAPWRMTASPPRTLQSTHRT